MTNARLAAIIKETLFLPRDTVIAETDGPGNMNEWDSLGHVNIIATIEDVFNISISPDEVLKISSVKDIEKLLKEKNVINE